MPREEFSGLSRDELPAAFAAKFLTHVGSFDEQFAAIVQAIR